MYDEMDTKRPCFKNNCESKAWETCKSFEAIICDGCNERPVFGYYVMKDDKIKCYKCKKKVLVIE